MAFGRKLGILLTASASAGIVLGGVAFGFLYYARRMNETDMLVVGTKSVGVQLVMYANEHGGQFPATLEETGFATNLDSYAEAYIRHLRPQYIRPTAGATNSVKMLIARNRWGKMVCYSDGNTEWAAR